MISCDACRSLWIIPGWRKHQTRLEGYRTPGYHRINGPQSGNCVPAAGRDGTASVLENVRLVVPVRSGHEGAFLTRLGSRQTMYLIVDSHADFPHAPRFLLLLGLCPYGSIGRLLTASPTAETTMAMGTCRCGPMPPRRVSASSGGDFSKV